MKHDCKWSDSKYDAYKSCLRKFYYKYLAKVKVTVSASPAMERGIKIHKLGEDYLNGLIEEVPPEYAAFSDQLIALRESDATAETDIGVTSKWDRSSMFARDVWLRGKVDAILCPKRVCTVIDFKTGKVYEDKAKSQADNYAAMVPSHIDGPITSVVVKFWYLDQAEDAIYKYPKAEIAAVRKQLVEKYRRADKYLISSGEKMSCYPCNKTFLCKYCDYSKYNGGSCDN